MDPSNMNPSNKNLSNNDDELGAALGASLSGRVDIPTPIPSFDGVERRARQITNRRRALAGAVVGALVLFGGVGLASLTGDNDTTLDDVITEPDSLEPAPTAPPTTAPSESDEPDKPDNPDEPAENPSEEPPSTDETVPWHPLADLELAGVTGTFAFDEVSPIPTNTALVGVVDTNVVRYEPDGTVTIPIGDPDIVAARIAADGSILIELANQPAASQARSSASPVIQIRDDSYRVLSVDGRITGVSTVDGQAVAFVGDFPTFDGTPEGDTGDLRMVDLATGESTLVGEDVFGIEWLVYETFVGADATVFLDGAGYQPLWAYRDLDGNFLDLASPTDGRNGSDWANEVDGVGPDVDRPALSADGSTLYWIELEAGGPSGFIPIAVLHSMNVQTGDEAEILEISLGPTSVPIHTDLTISGDQLLLTQSVDSVDEELNYVPTYLSPILIDLSTTTFTELSLSPAAWHFVG